MCLFQQADHRLSVGGNLLWPLDICGSQLLCVAGSRWLTMLVEASSLSADPDGYRGLSAPPVPARTSAPPLYLKESREEGERRESSRLERGGVGGVAK